MVLKVVREVESVVVLSKVVVLASMVIHIKVIQVIKSSLNKHVKWRNNNYFVNMIWLMLYLLKVNVRTM